MPKKLSLHPAADALDAALDQHSAEIHAIPADEVIKRINVDLATAVSIALGAQPALLAQLPTLRTQLPSLPTRYVEELHTFAYATLRAHMLVLTAPGAPDRLATLADKAFTLRKTLATDAAAAVARGLLDGDAFAEIPTGKARLEIASALIALNILFRAGWRNVAGKTAVTEEELDRAAQLGVELLTELGRDDNPTTSNTTQESVDLRLRAYTLFFKVYDECRRAMAWLRWHEDDANDFTPPLSGPRNTRPRKTVPDESGKGGAPGEGQPPA